LRFQDSKLQIAYLDACFLLADIFFVFPFVVEEAGFGWKEEETSF
jgi:hypothetical protein